MFEEELKLLDKIEELPKELNIEIRGLILSEVCLREENQQLKEELEEAEKARKNCYKYLKNPPEDVWSGHSLEKAIELLDIDKIDKGE